MIIGFGNLEQVHYLFVGSKDSRFGKARKHDTDAGAICCKMAVRALISGDLRSSTYTHLPTAAGSVARVHTIDIVAIALCLLRLIPFLSTRATSLSLCVLTLLSVVVLLIIIFPLPIQASSTSFPIAALFLCGRPGSISVSSKRSGQHRVGELAYIRIGILDHIRELD